MVVEKQLIKDCKQFDEKAQRKLYEKYSPVMFGICLRYCKKREEAEDLLQEGFLTIFTKIGQYSGEGSFIGWMRRVMVNTVLMSFRRKSHNEHHLDIGEVNELRIVHHHGEDIPDADPDDVKAMIEQADFSQEELLDAANKLPEGYRMVFNLSVVEGYKHREVAEALGISESTSKSQLLRARKVLQKNLYALSQEKNKEKIKKKLIYAFAFLGMNENFNYIDEILKKGFENLKVPPSTDWAAMSAKMGAGKATVGSAAGSSASAGAGSSATGVQQGVTLITKISSSVVSYISSHVFTVLSFMAATVVSVGLITGSSTIETQHADNILHKANSIEAMATQSVQSNEPSQTTELEGPIFRKQEATLISEKNNTQNADNEINVKPVTNETVYDTIKVPVTKTIYKTKTKIKRDTIRKERPVFIKK
ncbi:MAG: sigma-70 family RNA polymerase sigma factor [Bacteroidales bacterium]|nr:sigma-70 family RNA polymerase sigma factor [Bacteroidales bacterium]MCF8458926.1 sigma-70 family RNA polymerase sigma factor [Bacteroidales bacterium]